MRSVNGLRKPVTTEAQRHGGKYGSKNQGHDRFGYFFSVSQCLCGDNQLMEVEFDKEMDALLRRAAGRGVLVGDSPQKHMDADAIAAFAENALPEKSRMIYTQHLAVCDPCRTTLADLITLNAEAEPAMAAAAAPVAAASVPWYRALFASRNLAYTMGALVLVFGGLLGFIVLQNSNKGENGFVSKVEDSQMAANVPGRAEGANSLANAANANSNAASSVPGEIPRSVGVADEQLPAEPNAAAVPPPAFAPTSNTAAAPDKDQQSAIGNDKEKAAGQPGSLTRRNARKMNVQRTK